MADETDVEQILVGIVTAALYPHGTAQPSAAGVNCKIFRGWPTTQQQEDAKAHGYVNVSVSARNGVERNTARYPLVWQTVIPPVHTLTAVVSGKTITIGGVVATPQNVIALVGGSASQQVFGYAVQVNDTLVSIATGLASLIAASFPGTTSSGAVVTVNSTFPITARIAAAGTVIQEVGRQEKAFQVSIWAPPCPTVGADADAWRIAVINVIDPVLRPLIRLVMPDQVFAHIYYERSISMDTAQTEGLYRRDLCYWVEYATTITQTGYEIGVAQSRVQGGMSPTGTFPLPSDTPTLIRNS
jgi:hypothetical protein